MLCLCVVPGNCVFVHWRFLLQFVVCGMLHELIGPSVSPLSLWYSQFVHMHAHYQLQSCLFSPAFFFCVLLPLIQKSACLRNSRV